jgi:hypothetical protein
MRDYLSPLLDVNTFAGSVFSAVVGVAIVAFAGLLYQRLAKLRRQGSAVECAISTREDVESACYYGFRKIDREIRIAEGQTKDPMFIGVMANEPMTVVRIDLRPMQWSWLRLRYLDISEPQPVQFHVSDVYRDNHANGAHSVLPMMAMNRHGGTSARFESSPVVLRRGEALWVVTSARSKTGWAGVTSVNVTAENLEEFYSRIPTSVQPDDRLLNDVA